MPYSLGFMQTSISPTLHFQMGVTSTTGATKMSNVQTDMELRIAPTSVLDTDNIPKHIEKYYSQRHRLFHRFDEGIVLDDEGWYSVTPEKIAAHIAQRFEGREVILDLFSGVGGNCIQFALAGAYVIAVEISGDKIELARHNAGVYGVAEFIEFVQCDAMEFLRMLQDGDNGIDAAFLSPPWGGPRYQEKDVYDVSAFRQIVCESKRSLRDVAILLPRNVDAQNILEHFGACEIERNYLGDKLKTVTAYFGDLIAR